MIWLYLGIGLLAILIGVFAQVKVANAYSTFSKIENKRGLTGREVAQQILEANEITNISINCIKGNLSDHYNNKKKQLNLSNDVYNGTNIASVAVAAHEVGHAIQFKQGYWPIKLRNIIIPVSNFVSRLFWPLLIVGILMSVFASVENSGLYVVMGSAIILGFMVIVNLVTLPVEYDASRRALAEISDLNMLDEEELSQAKQMLSAAALTYLASFLMSVLFTLRDLLWIFTIFGDNN